MLAFEHVLMDDWIIYEIVVSIHIGIIVLRFIGIKKKMFELGEKENKCFDLKRQCVGLNSEMYHMFNIIQNF